MPEDDSRQSDAPVPTRRNRFRTASMGAVGTLLVTATISLLNGSAEATPANNLSTQLTKMWTQILQTPNSVNPFTNGGPGSGCFDLGGVLAPFAPAYNPAAVADCTVKPGTKLFIIGSSVECSTFSEDGTTYRAEPALLPDCAATNDGSSPPPVTLDNRPLTLTEVATKPSPVVLPADNIFGEPKGAVGQSAAHGWVALVHPLPPGPHTVVITPAGQPPVTTVIHVVPGS